MKIRDMPDNMLIHEYWSAIDDIDALETTVDLDEDRIDELTDYCIAIENEATQRGLRFQRE